VGNDGVGLWTAVAVGAIMLIGFVASIYLILDAMGVIP
jgi:hypothetical protein